MAPDLIQQQARALAGNPLLNQILDECRQTAIKRWESSSDPVVQSEAWSVVRAISQLQSQIKALIAESQK